MAMLVLDPYVEDAILEERRASGGDKYDEVWDGVYVMSPLANNEHQRLVSGLTFVFYTTVHLAGLGTVLPGANITDREDDWKQNYRCPDVVVFLNGTAAQDRDTHWLGGPDFAVEIASRYDRSRDKIPFYASIGTRELLLVDREPWALELYRLRDGALVLVGTSTLEVPATLPSEVVPLAFRLIVGENRPRIEITHRDGVQRWAA